jgi:integrating conjugative element protein (TIGR03749 family)
MIRKVVMNEKDNIVLVSTHLFATEIIHYENLPVTINLFEGQERSIQFGDHVSVGITKGQQSNKLFRIQSALGTIHILPHTSFDKQRIQIKRHSDGRILLLDLISRKAEPNTQSLEEVRIYLPTENVVRSSQQEIVEESRTSEQPSVSPIELTRFAAQRLYGPSRLHDDLQGVSETAIGVKGAIRIFKGDNKINTYSEAIVGYFGGGHYLVAIHIRNLSKKPVSLDYLDLNLSFDYATFQHHSLNVAGTPGDSTVLYLISKKPLNETLYPWTYYQDLEAKKKRSRSSHRD